MTIQNFTVEEINIVAIFLGATRAETIERITAALPLMGAEIAVIAENAVEKLWLLEEKEFENSSFAPADEADGE